MVERVGQGWWAGSLGIDGLDLNWKLVHSRSVERVYRIVT